MKALTILLIVTIAVYLLRKYSKDCPRETKW